MANPKKCTQYSDAVRVVLRGRKAYETLANSSAFLVHNLKGVCGLPIWRPNVR